MWVIIPDLSLRDRNQNDARKEEMLQNTSKGWRIILKTAPVTILNKMIYCGAWAG